MAWTEKQKKAHSLRMKAAWGQKRASGGSVLAALKGRPTETEHDPVAHPPHYCNHPSGIECIQVTEHMNFCRGNAIKYIWRAGEKGDELEDLRKARWYVDREIERIQNAV